MKRLFQSNGNGAHRKSAIDSDLLRILVPPVICVVICCTFFVGASWAWFYDTATCAVEDIKIKTNLGTKVNVTVTDMSAVIPMLLAAAVESTEAEEETEQPTEWTLEPNEGYDVTLKWPVDENAQIRGYCVITIGSSQYRTVVFSNTLRFYCYTTGMENPVVMKIDGFSGGYEAMDGEEIIDNDYTIGEPTPAPAPEATASPEPTPAPEATASPEPTPAPEATASPEPTPTEEPTAAPTTEPAPETSVSPESTPTEEPTTENAEGQEQSEAQTSAPASQG